jgi:hypothetical protein
VHFVSQFARQHLAGLRTMLVIDQAELIEFDDA